MDRFKGSDSFTIVFRDGALTIVARARVAANGNANPVGVDSCEVDFLDGRATRSGQPAQAPGPPLALAAWTSGSIPAACRFQGRQYSPGVFVGYGGKKRSLKRPVHS